MSCHRRQVECLGFVGVVSAAISKSCDTGLPFVWQWSCGHEWGILCCTIRYPNLVSLGIVLLADLSTCSRNFRLGKNKMFFKINLLLSQKNCYRLLRKVFVLDVTEVFLDLRNLWQSLLSLKRNLNQISLNYVSGSAKMRFKNFSGFFATNRLATCDGLKHKNADAIFTTAQMPLLLLYLRLPLWSIN